MSARMIIVRHAEAQGNKERTFQGHTDGAVSEKGLLQLEALAERFRTIHIDRLYASPLSRTVQTAQAVNKYHGLPLQTDPRLIEIDAGVMEKMPWRDMPVLYPEQAVNWDKYPHLFAPDKGEHMTEVYARISSAICDIAAQNDGLTVAVASHGCAIRNLLCWAKGWEIERLSDVQWCDNTGVSIIDIEDGVPTLVMENDCSHIPEELSTFATQRWWREKRSMVWDD